jgi:hypothetical protein
MGAELMGRPKVLLSFTALVSISYWMVIKTDAFSPSPNEIHWTTQSEDVVYGYDIYRSENKAGPFMRLNPETINGAGTTDMPSTYYYADRDIKAGKVYWYYIESIDMSGERKRLTPVYASKPKSIISW